MKYFPQKPPSIDLTKEYKDKLEADQKKYNKLQEEILIRVQAAREMGDLSENGAYKYAKFELGNVRRELKRINFLLRFGVIKETNNDGTADFGSMIKLKNSDREMNFMLVSEHEADPSQKKLSVDSPYGKAVIGKRVGDMIKVEAPAGVIEFEIIEIG